MFIENILLALHNLSANKIKTLLTELGIIIGIFSVILIMTLGDTLSFAIDQNLQGMGARDVYLVVGSKETKDEVDIDGIKFGELDNNGISRDDYITSEMIIEMTERFKDDIYAVNLSYSAGNGTTSNKNKSVNVSITGTSVGYYVSNDLDILAGHTFTEDDYNGHKKVTLVSKDFVDNLYEISYDEMIGKEITVQMNNTTETFSVIGVYEDNSAMAMQTSMFINRESIYVPLMTALDITHEIPAFQVVQVVANINHNPDELAGKLENFFAGYYRLNPYTKVSAITFTSVLNIVNTLINTVTMVIAVIAAISLVVGGVGIMNIMLASVMERTKEIGTRVALGASKNNIRLQFITEAVILCLMGGIIGVILGVATGIAASTYMGYPTWPKLDAILIALSFSVATGLFFGYYPANKAAKMNPIDALRYE